MELFLGIDLGTTYFKAGLFDENGKLRGLGRQSVKKSVSKSNIEYELPVDVFWSTLRRCIIEALNMAQASSNDIKAISYSSQANSFLLLDDHNKPLTPLILWPDTRAEEMVPLLAELGMKSNFHEKTGLGIDLSSHSCIAKLLWFQKKQPLLWDRVKSIMTISDYLTFELTGQQAGDLSTASLLALLDVKNGKWWNEALQLVNIDSSQLSTLHLTGTLIGELTDEGAQNIGLSFGIPFCLGGLDHHIAAVGAGLSQSNDISESTGTVLASVNYQEQFIPRNKVCTAPGLDESHYFQMTFDENGAGSLEWYQKTYAPEFNIAELLEMASNIKAGSEGLVAKPCASKYKNLEGFENIKPIHQQGHFVRAILESTALTLAEIVERLTDKNQADRIVATGGGAMSRLWIEIKADLLEKEFFIPECSETACLGAAMFAATSIKRFKNIQEASEKWIKKKDIVKPNPANSEFYSKWAQNKKLIN